VTQIPEPWREAYYAYYLKARKYGAGRFTSQYIDHCFDTVSTAQQCEKNQWAEALGVVVGLAAYARRNDGQSQEG
jgi:hypothetical protein